MFLKDLKNKIILERMELLIKHGINEGTIVPFDKELYDVLNKTLIFDIPVDIYIKYLKPTLPPGKCYDRSLYMFLSFEDAVLVRGDVKNLIIKYGEEEAGHGWMERDGYVYDPTFMLIFKQEDYYRIFQPTNIQKSNMEEYRSNKACNEFYNKIRQTTRESLRINGPERYELIVTIPLVQNIANMTGKKEFIDELNKYLDEINYNYEAITNQINDNFRCLSVSQPRD